MVETKVDETAVKLEDSKAVMWAVLRVEKMVALSVILTVASREF